MIFLYQGFHVSVDPAKGGRGIKDNNYQVGGATRRNLDAKALGIEIVLLGTSNLLTTIQIT
jgi:hypothetical protein